MFNNQPILQLSHSEADELIAKVDQKIAQGTFDHQDQQLIKQMVECLGDTRGLTRLAYAEALGRVGKSAVEPLIDALLNHANVVVRRAAAKTIALIEDPRAVSPLIQALLNDQDTVVQSSSVGALARTGEASVTPLLQILSSPDSSESHKGHAAWALAFIGIKAKDELYAAYDSNSPEVRAAVVGAIAKVAEEENNDLQAFNLLLQSLQDPSANVRSEAAAVLGNLKYQPAIPVLTELLNHSSGETRKSAALSLMKISDRRSIEPLQATLAQETDEGIKKAISLAISILDRQSEADDW